MKSEEDLKTVEKLLQELAQSMQTHLKEGEQLKALGVTDLSPEGK